MYEWIIEIVNEEIVNDDVGTYIIVHKKATLKKVADSILSGDD